MRPYSLTKILMSFETLEDIIFTVWDGKKYVTTSKITGVEYKTDTQTIVVNLDTEEKDETNEN